MPRTRCYTLKQAVQLIVDSSDSENEDVAELCILPPDDGADSEVEAIDDDDLSPNEPSDVCGEIDVFTRHSDADNQAGTEKQEKRGAAQKSRKRKAPSSDANKQKYEFTCDGKICFVRWSDNNVVTCGSN